MSLSVAGPSVAVSTKAQNHVLRVPWGEESRLRLSGADTQGALSILENSAPSGFAVPRHIHHREHEIVRVVSGQMVVWTPDRSFVMVPGELALLPKGVPHAWKAYGDQPLRWILDFVPAGFENIYPLLIERQVGMDDIAAINKITAEFGIEIVGPPLTDEDVVAILLGEKI